MFCVKIYEDIIILSIIPLAHSEFLSCQLFLTHILSVSPLRSLALLKLITINFKWRTAVYTLDIQYLNVLPHMNKVRKICFAALTFHSFSLTARPNGLTGPHVFESHFITHFISFDGHKFVVKW